MPYRLRGPGQRWIRSLLGLTYGSENVFRPDSTADAEEMSLGDTLQPVLVVNSLQDNPFNQIDERITTEVYNPNDGTGEVPLKVTEVNPHVAVATRQFVRVELLSNVINLFTVTGDRPIGPFSPFLWTYNAGDNLLPYGIIRHAGIEAFWTGSGVNRYPWLFGPGNRTIALTLSLIQQEAPYYPRMDLPSGVTRVLDSIYVGGDNPHDPKSVIEAESERFIPVSMRADRFTSPPTLQINGFSSCTTVGALAVRVRANVLIEVWSTGGSERAPYLRNNADTYPFVDGYALTALKPWQ